MRVANRVLQALIVCCLAVFSSEVMPGIHCAPAILNLGMISTDSVNVSTYIYSTEKFSVEFDTIEGVIAEITPVKMAVSKSGEVTEVDSSAVFGYKVNLIVDVSSLQTGKSVRSVVAFRSPEQPGKPIELQLVGFKP